MPRAPLVALLALAPAAPAAPVDFNRDVRPILFDKCVACHGPDEEQRKADLRLDTRDGAVGGDAIVPGKPDESPFLQRVASHDKSEVMPPPKTGKSVTPAEVATLREWVKQGASYAVHWSYAPPKRPAAPAVKRADWPRGDLDRFILAKLEAEGLTPSPEADRHSLARRLSLDLTGLPPTPERADAFAGDTRPDAVERYVDELLANPAYGEHWARLWLDLARYADSAGYADDPTRTIWPYRDWVIRALNRNLPFDQFTVEQLAGDLLPNPTDDQLIATAFHRNTMTNNEGGTSDEEFRNAAIVDRVNTTFAVWMGTSMACAQCHTHKYDPITQTEYFRVFALLNQTADADRPDESPTIPVGDTPERRAKRDALTARQKEYERPRPLLPALVQGAQKALAEQAKKEAAALAPPATVPVLRELPAEKRRTTKLQRRGNFQDLGDAVTGGVPAVFGPLPAGPADRLALARWLVDAKNPLTARVLANRFWEQLFGTGLVRTSEEFGAQGESPSHPELLDFLATELVRLKWDQKAFLKMLVTSATYRQSSRESAELRAKDADNRYYGRGPRFRLSAEMVRDQALAASGLLSPKLYGPPVKPPQPSFGLSAAFGRTLDWQTSSGPDRYRRGLYTEWRRTNPYPSMATFDAPSREACTVRRTRSNTPLQALVTLNDPVYVEAAQSLGRLAASAPGGVPEQAAAAFRRVLVRPPTPKEVERLTRLFTETRERYRADEPAARKLATEPLGPLPAGADAATLAAWTVVANVVLNLDEAFLKR